VNDELCIFFFFVQIRNGMYKSQFICAQMGARFRFILNNRRLRVSFFVSACKGTQCVWPILIKLRTVDLHYSCECCFDYFKGHICARSSCCSGTCVKKNPYRTEYCFWRITLTVVMIFNLISSTCIKRNFSAAEKKSDLLWLCYTGFTVQLLYLLTLWTDGDEILYRWRVCMCHLVQVVLTFIFASMSG